MLKKCKKVLSIMLVAAILSTLMLFSGGTVSAATYSGYVMSYFKQVTNGYGLYLAYSTDGFHWSALNGGNAVVYPKLGTQGLRDPYVFRQKDGTFGVVATDMLGTSWGDHSQYIHYWGSADLCDFSDERLLKVHNTAMHAWAPEVFYNYDTKQYGIIWSGNTDYNRTYVNYTTDFSTLTSNEVYFDPGYDVIDSSIQQHNGTAYLFFKDERASGKAIKAAKSTSAVAGSYSVFTPNFITSAYTEGPLLFKDNNSNTWYMYADLFANNGNFECWKTTDLNATSWTKVTNFSLPSGVRHAGITSVTQSELDKLIAYYPSPYIQIRNRATNINIDGYGYTANGSNCRQYSDNPSYNQQWLIETDGSYVKIKNRATGLYLDGMGRTTNGSIAGQWSSSNSNNQKWIKETIGSYVKFKNVATNLYLDGMGRSSNGSDLGQWSSSSSYNQQWYLETP